MEKLLRPLINHCASRPTTVAVLLVDRSKEMLTARDLFDVIIYAVATNQEKPEHSKHFYLQGTKVGLIVVEESLFRERVLSSSDTIRILKESEVLFERDRYIESILREAPIKDNEFKMGLEFAGLVRAYTTGKKLFMDGHCLDAYGLLVNSLHHLARMALIEKGIQAESALWRQIKNSEPEILKLYEELITNEEPIEKRLELLFLASGFLIHSKTPQGAKHILEVLSERHIWHYEMIKQHPKIKRYGSDLDILLEYLIEKDLIIPIQIESNIKGIYERCYKVKKTC